ncbi:hypothetical protein ACFSN5_03340 [Streptococcus tangpeifui]|uniref:hypothetical protein n=1 Tax=Streptococcus tangpeifui TaxID=2709400 RepID=UPI001982369C|nr:hypothetical protein [Streptococcus sp. ZJ373]
MHIIFETRLRDYRKQLVRVIAGKISRRTPYLYADPLPDLMAVLENSDDAIDMYLHYLPEKI